RLERGGRGVGEALAVVVVDIGDGDAAVVRLVQQLGQHLARIGVGRGGAEDEVVVVQPRQRRRGRGRRDQHHAAGDGGGVGGGDRLARAERADQPRHVLRIDHAVGGGRGRG